MEDYNKLVAELNDIKEHLRLDITSHPVKTVSTLKDQLRSRYVEYKLPWMSLTSYDCHVKQNIKRLIADAKERNNLLRLWGRPANNSNEEFWKSQKTFTVKNGFAMVST